MTNIPTPKKHLSFLEFIESIQTKLVQIGVSFCVVEYLLGSEYVIKIFAEAHAIWVLGLTRVLIILIIALCFGFAGYPNMVKAGKSIVEAFELIRKVFSLIKKVKEGEDKDV